MHTPMTPPAPHVELDDLGTLGHLLPHSAVTLIRVAGAQPALALLRAWPGVLYPCPKHPDANTAGARRWAQLADLVGDGVMPGIAAHYGGGVLDIPVCTALLAEKRHRWIRARFDDLVSPSLAALSSHAAIHELTLALAEAGQPMTAREVKKIVGRSDNPGHVQHDLFSAQEPTP